MPLHDHDCSACVFLGTRDGLDWYVCPQGGWPTIVARSSPDGPDYESGESMIDRIPAEWVASARALMRGLRKHPDEWARECRRRRMCERRRNNRRRRRLGWLAYLDKVMSGAYGDNE